MSLPLALQLCTLPGALAEDFAGVVTSVAEIGYAGVEPAGFPGVTVAQARAQRTPAVARGRAAGFCRRGHRAP